MSTMPKTIVALLLSFLILLPWESEAQTPGHTLYVKNRLSAQFVAGALFSPVSWVHEHPVINYAQTNLRFGWMATEPTKSKLIGKSNFELLFELTNSAVFLGPGNYLRGFTLLGRFNLLLPNLECGYACCCVFSFSTLPASASRILFSILARSSAVFFLRSSVPPVRRNAIIAMINATRAMMKFKMDIMHAPFF